MENQAKDAVAREGKGEQTSQSYSEKLGSNMLPEIEQASNYSNKLHEANKLGNLISYTRQLFQINSP